MTVASVERELQGGKLRPVYLIVGEEQHLAQRLFSAIRARTLEGDRLGLNDDHFTAGESSVKEVLGVARTYPMMQKHRFVSVRQLERWESPGKALDELADYLLDPATSSVLVLLARKLDKRRRLSSVAKKRGYWIDCEPLRRHEVPRYLEQEALKRHNRLAPGVAELMVELMGHDLSQLTDALERLSLFVGDGQSITEETVSECLVRLKTRTVWELVQAVGRQDVGASLAALDEVFDPHDRGLRLLGVLGWSTRQLLQFQSAQRAGKSPQEAAKAAGAPPFKARELSEQVRSIPPHVLERWVETLASLDLDLKGGSRRSAKATIEYAILKLCQVSHSSDFSSGAISVQEQANQNRPN